jgi:hypothetical protein
MNIRDFVFCAYVNTTPSGESLWARTQLFYEFQTNLLHTHGYFEEQNKVFEYSINYYYYCIINNKYYNYIFNA